MPPLLVGKDVTSTLQALSLASRRAMGVHSQDRLAGLLGLASEELLQENRQNALWNFVP